MHRALMIPLALLTMATAAHATVFASGKLYGGPSQDDVTCYILNTGTKSVALSTVAITGENGQPVPVGTTCGATLAGHSGCATSSRVVSTGSAYDCSVNASAVAYLRGSVEVRSNSQVLQVQPLR